MAPVRAGATVQRQRYLAGKWVHVSSAAVRSNGTYTFEFVWNAAGTYTYRVVAPGTGQNAAGVSPTAKVKVS